MADPLSGHFLRMGNLVASSLSWVFQIILWNKYPKLGLVYFSNHIPAVMSSFKTDFQGGCLHLALILKEAEDFIHILFLCSIDWILTECQLSWLRAGMQNIVIKEAYLCSLHPAGRRASEHMIAFGV